MKLLVLFQGPAKLIEKRGDKRLDYDSAQNKFERNREDKIVRILQIFLQCITYEHKEWQMGKAGHVEPLFTFSLMGKNCLHLNAWNFVNKCSDMLPSDLQNLEGMGFVNVQPSYNLYQSLMWFNVPHMRGTLNHIFHERRQ